MGRSKESKKAYEQMVERNKKKEALWEIGLEEKEGLKTVRCRGTNLEQTDQILLIFSEEPKELRGCFKGWRFFRRIIEKESDS